VNIVVISDGETKIFPYSQNCFLDIVVTDDGLIRGEPARAATFGLVLSGDANEQTVIVEDYDSFLLDHIKSAITEACQEKCDAAYIMPDNPNLNSLLNHRCDITKGDVITKRNL
jgi:hypothetical protein